MLCIASRENVTVRGWSDVCTVVEAYGGNAFQEATNTIGVALQRHLADIAPPSQGGVEPVLQYTFESS